MENLTMGIALLAFLIGVYIAADYLMRKSYRGKNHVQLVNAAPRMTQNGIDFMCDKKAVDEYFTLKSQYGGDYFNSPRAIVGDTKTWIVQNTTSIKE